MRRKSKTVSVRIDLSLLEVLQERAELLDLSPGLWLRKLVENELMRPFDAEQLEKQVRRLREKQAIALYYTLTLVGKMPSEKANELVRSKILGE